MLLIVFTRGCDGGTLGQIGGTVEAVPFDFTEQSLPLVAVGSGLGGEPSRVFIVTTLICIVLYCFKDTFTNCSHLVLTIICKENGLT